MDEALRAEEVRAGPRHRPGHQARLPPRGQAEVERRIDSIAAAGRKRIFRSVDFVTYTLKYNKMNWVTIDALGEHWARASVRARLVGDSAVEVVTRERHRPDARHAPRLVPARPGADRPADDRLGRDPRPPAPVGPSWHVELVKDGDVWERRPPLPPASGRRDPDGSTRPDPRPGRPTPPSASGTTSKGRSTTPSWTRSSSSGPPARRSTRKVGDWAEQEGDRAVEHWRRHFRGEARVKDDAAITDADIASSNLILWGDPESNAVLKRIADKLPIRWEGDKIVVGAEVVPGRRPTPRS